MSSPYTIYMCVSKEPMLTFLGSESCSCYMLSLDCCLHARVLLQQIEAPYIFACHGMENTTALLPMNDDLHKRALTLGMAAGGPEHENHP